jgi:hypothetical protein
MAPVSADDGSVMSEASFTGQQPQNARAGPALPLSHCGPHQRGPHQRQAGCYSRGMSGPPVPKRRHAHLLTFLPSLSCQGELICCSPNTGAGFCTRPS